MAIRIHVEGVQETITQLAQSAEKIQQGIAKGVAEGGKIVEANAKSLCPVSTEETRPGGPHGELRASILSEASGNTAVIGTNKEYAIYVEFGTYKMAAQPYMVPALKSSTDAVIAAIAAAVGV